MVKVECVENGGQILFTYANFKVTTRFGELLQRKGVAAIVVHYFEHPLQSDNPTRASGLDAVPEQLHHVVQLLLLFRLLRRVLCLLSWLRARKLGIQRLGELLVVKLTVARLIVVAEDVVQIPV